ncbi:MAG TPA: glutamyl-tRNA reductase [Lentisphaeria bacterium]|nr:MAG: glutamyl-tRNA reductase [Lentisphaerae bacterium GWF2_38_69]HBM16496.1 glutamyl-tRNA reductase [Lentisphaeria bacterium]
MILLYKKDLDSTLADREGFLKKLPETKENHVLLATCNRVELYTGDGPAPEDVARHLFRVASGLDSALLGENAILGQLKDSYFNALNQGMVSKGLNILFQKAIAVGKKVRAETKISHGAMSHSLAVLEILLRKNLNLGEMKFLILGASNINKDVIRYLTRKGGRTIFVANRTFEKALLLSREMNCEAIRFDSFYDLLNEVDVVISATAAPHFVIRKELYQVEGKQILFDLAVPRDIDPEISSFGNIELYNIEDIERQIDNNLKARSKEINIAEKIIEEECSKYFERFRNISASLA